MIISSPFPPEDGIGYHVYNISKKLIEHGHKVTIITRGSLSRNEFFRYDGIDVIKVFFAPLYPLHVKIHGFFVNKLLNKLEDKFDIIHVHTPLSPLINTSLPVVNTIHSSITEDARHIEKMNIVSINVKLQTKLISYNIIKKTIQKSTLTSTVSESVVCELKKDYHFDNAFITSNGVNHKELYPLSNNTKENYILYVGRLSYRKGLFELIEAAQSVIKKHNVKFLIVGKGEWENTIKKNVLEKGLEKEIIFLGHVDRKDLVSRYQNANIFVMPSRYESGPLTVLEAMSCGKPVIATSVGIVPEVIENMKNGIIIPPNSVNDLINSINLLLENEELKEKLGINARKTVQEKYTWDIVVNNVEKYYQIAINKKGCSK
jgi:glycosyltransferase involved in cell wall biosynthesis